MTAPAARTLEAHAAAYDLVARLYLHGPAALAPAALPGRDALLDALGRLDLAWPARLEPLLAAVADDARRAELEQAYDDCVVQPIPGRYVPPYASVYLGEPGLWTSATLEVEQTYARAGFVWDAGTSRARPRAPDHLGLELAFLAVSEAEAGPAPTAAEADRLGRFLDGHLLRWLPDYLDALRNGRVDAFFVTWVEWLCALAHHDRERLSRQSAKTSIRSSR